MSDVAAIEIRPAQAADHAQVKSFLNPFIQAEFLLPRSDKELAQLLRWGFVAVCDSKIVGFAAVEVYSKKLAELQCLAVSTECRRLGVGRRLVNQCVDVARQQGVAELMAISASDQLFIACGFDYSLPNQKRALFIQP